MPDVLPVAIPTPLASRQFNFPNSERLRAAECEGALVKDREDGEAFLHQRPGDDDWRKVHRR